MAGVSKMSPAIVKKCTIHCKVLLTLVVVHTPCDLRLATAVINHKPNMMAPYTVTPNRKLLLDLPSFIDGPRATLNDDQVSVTAQLIVDCRCQLGESVLWDDRTEDILFVSILDKTFHKLSLANNTTGLVTFSLPKMAGSFGLLENPPERGAYLFAWEDGFQIYNVETNQPISEMSLGEPVNPLGLPDRLNDGRCDPTGKRFICGGCAGNPDSTLKVYKCEYNSIQWRLEHTPIVDSIRTTNSICWSLDGNTMYLADSPDLKIHQYNYDVSNGTVSNKRHLHNKPTGFADGSCIDAQDIFGMRHGDKGKVLEWSTVLIQRRER